MSEKQQQRVAHWRQQIAEHQKSNQSVREFCRQLSADSEDENHFMQLDVFLKSLYLGDRACKGFALDSWNREFKICVDEISRIHDGSSRWDYDAKGSIEDGFIVFGHVRRLSFEPPGLLPNDYINSIEARPIEEAGEPTFEILISISSVDDTAESKEVIVRLVASDAHLEDPKRPGEKLY